MATTGARTTTYTDVHATLQAQIKGSEGASAETATAVAGRTYRLLSGASQQTAKTYAESMLQEQVAKIQTLFAQYGPQEAEDASRIHPDTVTGLNAALSTIGIGIEKSDGPAQKLTSSAQFKETKAAYLSSRELTDLTELTGEAPAKVKHGTIQTQLRLEIAKTAVLIEEFFSGLDDKTIQLETAEVLDSVLKEVGLQLKKVELPALREAQVVTPPVVITEGLDAGINPSFNLLRGVADKLMLGDQFTYLNETVIEQVENPIVKVLKHCIAEDTCLFDATKIDDEIDGATEDAKAYVRLASKDKSTKQEFVEQLEKDVATLHRYAYHFNYPIGLIRDLVIGYAEMLTIHEEDEKGLARLDRGGGQHYEITLANKHAQLAAIILQNMINIFTEYTSEGTEDFDFEKFSRENPQDQNEILHALVNHLRDQTVQSKIAPTKDALIALIDLPFEKAFTISQVADEELLKRSQPLPPLSEEQRAALTSRKAKTAPRKVEVTEDRSPGFISRHKGKLGTAAALTAAGVTAYATGGTSMLLPLLAAL